MTKKEKNESWAFWKDIILKKDGSINITQLKKELSDFSFILGQVPKVYCHITGNAMSKPNYYADTVIRVADDHFNESIKKSVLDMFEDMKTEGVITNKIKNRLKEYAEKYF